MPTDNVSSPDVREVLDRLGLDASEIVVLKDVPFANGSWLVETRDHGSFVLRRYHDRATSADLAYEHAVLRHLAGLGWMVPEPVGPLVEHHGRWYCPTRHIPGEAIRHETADQRRRRGCDLARLHLALRGLEQQVGQRPGWRSQHTGVTVHTDVDWVDCLHVFVDVDPRLASWAADAGVETAAALADLGAGDLPVTVVHGDFAEWNVHYADDVLAGVVDFGLTHVDSRPYELAIARTYRSPETVASYREELARNGWPLSELEEVTIEPVHRAFRVDMVAWQLDHGRRTGEYDLAMIERQLSRTGTTPP